jgi:hypothetical protein
LTVLLAVHYIDLLIIIPANLFTFLSGIIFSKFTKWGFLKHRWIMLKYIINIIPIIFGGIVIAPAIINMLSIVEKLGELALMDSSFISSKNIFIESFVVQLVLLVVAICLVISKPKLRRK